MSEIQVQDHPSIKVILPGVSGVGKSTLLEKLVRKEKARWKFLYDHKQGDLARRFGVRACKTINDLVEATEKGGYVIFDPGLMYPGHPEKGFAFFCDYVWNICTTHKGVKVFGTDELNSIIDTRNCPDEFLIILDQGRTFQINCFFIAQSMNEIHNSVRKQMTEVFAFRQGDENGAVWLNEKGIGLPPHDVMKLNPGEFLYKNLNTGKFSPGGKSFVPKNSDRDIKGL